MKKPFLLLSFIVTLLSTATSAHAYEAVFVYCKAELKQKNLLIDYVKAEHVYRRWSADTEKTVEMKAGEIHSKSYKFSVKAEDKDAKKIVLSVERRDAGDPDGDTTWVKTLITDNHESNFMLQLARSDVRDEAVETISCEAYTD